MRLRSTIKTKDGITWYYEQEGSGPDVFLILDGIGDCFEFDKAMSLIANQGFAVTTFDNPGMSRFSNAPPDAYQNVTTPKLATQVIGLLDELHIHEATFWGSSSGGATVLALATGYPERTRNGLPHEVPTGEQKFFTALVHEDDNVIAKTMAEGFSKQFPTDIGVWEALGEDFHARLWKNYPRWVRGYGVTLTPSIPMTNDDLTKKPLDWSVGAATPTAMFIDNIVTAVEAGISVRVLPGTHFPYITDPEAFADDSVKMTRKYL